MKKKVLSVFLLALIALLAVTVATALPVTIDKVKINGDVISPTSANEILNLERDQQIEVRVEVTASSDIDNAQIEAYLRGYDHDDLIQDITDVFDMKENRTYIKKLYLKLPYRVDKDVYKLRIRVEDRDGDSTEQTYELDISSKRHELMIKDVLFSPANYVISGRALLTTVRLKNTGLKDEDSVKVQVQIPAMGLSAADYVDEIDEDESTTSEELYMRIPKCQPEGDYQVVVTVTYDEGDETEKVTKTIHVVKDDSCNSQAENKDQNQQVPKTIITIGPTSQDLTRGEGGVIYPLTLSNAGTESKTYIITADGFQSWGDLKISPANVVILQPGEAKAVYLYLSAKETAQPGQHMFTVSVTSGAKQLKQFSLTANVVNAPASSASGWNTVKKVLEVSLIILVILLVILGLIIGFSRMKGPEDKDEEESQTYY